MTEPDGVQAGGPVTPSLRQRWQRYWLPTALRRLGQELSDFEIELGALVGEQRKKTPPEACPYDWDQRSQACVETAKAALVGRNSELGWLNLKAAKRFRLYGLDEDELRHVAAQVLTEATDTRKGVSAWRVQSISDLLADKDGDLKASVTPAEVVEAVKLLDGHHDNTFRKQSIVGHRLEILSLVSAVAVIAWIIASPRLASLNEFITGTGWWAPRVFWLSLVMAGIVGALLSAFTSAITKDVAKARIPEEMWTSTLIIAQIAVGGLSAIAMVAFLGSGVLALGTPSYELLVALAIVAGFTDRLLVSAVESTVKGVRS